MLSHGTGISTDDVELTSSYGDVIKTTVAVTGGVAVPALESFTLDIGAVSNFTAPFSSNQWLDVIVSETTPVGSLPSTIAYSVDEASSDYARVETNANIIWINSNTPPDVTSITVTGTDYSTGVTSSLEIPLAIPYITEFTTSIDAETVAANGYEPVTISGIVPDTLTLDPSKLTYSSSDEAVAIVEYNTATKLPQVTWVGEGTCTLTFMYPNNTTDETYWTTTTLDVVCEAEV